MYIHNSNKNVKKSKEKVNYNRYNLPKILKKKKHSYYIVPDYVDDLIISNCKYKQFAIFLYTRLIKRPEMFQMNTLRELCSILSVSSSTLKHTIDEFVTLNILERYTEKGKGKKYNYRLCSIEEIQHKSLTGDLKSLTGDLYAPEPVSSKEEERFANNLLNISIDKITRDNIIYKDNNITQKKEKNLVTVLEKKNPDSNSNIHFKEYKDFENINRAGLQEYKCKEVKGDRHINGTYKIHYNETYHYSYKEKKAYSIFDVYIQVASEVFQIEKFLDWWNKKGVKEWNKSHSYKRKQINCKTSYKNKLIEYIVKDNQKALFGYQVLFEFYWKCCYRKENYINDFDYDKEKKKDNFKNQMQAYAFMGELKDKLKEQFKIEIDENSDKLLEEKKRDIENFKNKLYNIDLSNWKGANIQQLQVIIDFYKELDIEDYKKQYEILEEKINRSSIKDKIDRLDFLKMFVSQLKNKFL